MRTSTAGWRLVGLLIVGWGPSFAQQPQDGQRQDTHVKPLQTSRPQATPEASVVATEGPVRAKAAELYAQHCAACHGERGDGAGPAAVFLYPKPRNFRDGRFRLISTANGVPTLADLEQSIRRGLPGSAMVPWPLFSDDELRLLAEHTLDFRRQGVRDFELAAAAEN